MKVTLCTLVLLSLLVIVTSVDQLQIGEFQLIASEIRIGEFIWNEYLYSDLISLLSCS